jgi:septum formation protein
MSRFILASKSPRRREILSGVGIEHEIIASDKEEIITKETPSDIVMELSKQKALDVLSKVKEDVSYNIDEDFIILAADTVVAIDGKILGKPRDRQDAYEMIQRIQGKTHSVFTGVTLIKKDIEEKIHTFSEETVVEVYPITHETIEKYLDKMDWTDKAGAYAIQGQFSAYVKRIEGDYYTVVGLPISRVIYELSKF